MKNIVITILSMLLIGLGSFLVYDKFIKEETIVNCDNKDAIENNATSEQIDTNIMDKFIGIYKHEGEYINKKEEEIEKMPVDEVIEADQQYKFTYEILKLNSSGYAEAYGYNVNGGGSDAKGKWYISENKLIIVNELCEEYVYSNCDHIWTYTYKIENNKVVLTSNIFKASGINLNKVN